MFVVGKKRDISYKKGQFTIFVIIGLVIFFVFMFAIFSRAKVISLQMTSQTDRQIRGYISQNAIDAYVTSCLDAVTDEIILTAAMQGGMLNSSGKILGVNYIQYNDSRLNRTFNVSIAVDANINCPDGRNPIRHIVTQSAGNYPYSCGNQYLADLPILYWDYGPGPCRNNCTFNEFMAHSGFFGVNNLPILCDYFGMNAPNMVSGENSVTCDYYDLSPNSLQKQIEKKISLDMDRCLNNFTEILERTPSNITMTGNATTKVVFKRGEFSVIVEYPFTVVMYNKQPVTKMIDFSIDRQMDLKALYEYTYELTNHDVSDVLFDVMYNRSHVSSYSNRRFGANIYDSRYVVNVSFGDSTNGYINMVQVTDTGSEIKGVPLTINYAVRNRIPALEYIHMPEPKPYDIATFENSTIILAPRGYDPDEETIEQYIYSGWRETYIDFYNFSDPNCTSPKTMAYVIDNCTKVNRSIVLPPTNWTRSPEFVNTRQNATYTTTGQDMGFHTVTITILDRQGLIDYQIVRILVIDLPIAKMNGSNSYSDVPDGYASFEDIYILNGSSSTAGRIGQVMEGATLSRFRWNDPLEPEVINFDKNIIPGDYSTMSLILPQDVMPPNTLNIMNIVDHAFRRTSPSVHPIQLTIYSEAGLEHSNTYPVTVVQCLNHSGTYPPYPYDKFYGIAENNLTGHLRANHTCCGGMTYKGTTATCFSSTVYGLNRTFRDYRTNTSLAPYHTINYVGTGSLSAPNNRMDNDIFVQTFTRNCSGDRGNICSGSASEVRTLFSACRDDNNVPVNPSIPTLAQNNPARVTDFQMERCSGPDRTYSTNPSINPIRCVNYSYSTASSNYWNRTFNRTLGSGTGFCTGTIKRFSVGWGSINTFFAAGNKNFVCNGACDGRGGCTVALNCECRIGYGDGSPACNGVNWGSTDAMWTLKSPLPGLGTCTSVSYLGDFSCDNACHTVIGAAGNICRSSTYGAGCTANEACNGYAPGYVSTAPGNQYICTPVCQVINCTQMGQTANPMTGTCVT